MQGILSYQIRKLKSALGRISARESLARVAEEIHPFRGRIIETREIRIYLSRRILVVAVDRPYLEGWAGAEREARRNTAGNMEVRGGTDDDHASRRGQEP